MPSTRNRARCGSSQARAIRATHASGECALVARWQDYRFYWRPDERRRRGGRRHLCHAGWGRRAARSDGASKVVAKLVPVVAIVEADSDWGERGGRLGDFARSIWRRAARRPCGKAPRAGLFSGDASTSAVVRNSWNQPPEVWAGATGKWRQITHSNDSQPASRPQHVWGEAKSIEWKNGGFDVQGWLMFPQPYDPAKRYPMLVDVHGGPASVARAAVGRARSCRCNCFPGKATSSSCRIRAAVMGKAKISRAPT